MHPGTSKGHFTEMCSLDQSWCFPSHWILVLFLRSFSCIQPLLCVSTAFSNPEHQLAGLSSHFLPCGGWFSKPPLLAHLLPSQLMPLAHR